MAGDPSRGAMSVATEEEVKTGYFISVRAFFFRFALANLLFPSFYIDQQRILFQLNSVIILIQSISFRSRKEKKIKRVAKEVKEKRRFWTGSLLRVRMELF